MATISASTASTDRNNKVLYTFDMGAVYPFALYQPVQKTGESQYVTFEYFRFPEPKQSALLIEGDSILSLINKDISSPPSFTLSTDNTGSLPVDTLILQADFDLKDSIFGAFPQAYFISYEYDLNYDFQNYYHYAFNVTPSSEWFGGVGRLAYRLNWVDPDNTGDILQDFVYDEPLGTTPRTINSFGTFIAPDTVHTQLWKVEITILKPTGFEIITIPSGATLDIEYNLPIPYVDDPDGFNDVIPRVDIWQLDNVTTTISNGEATATILASKSKIGDISTTLQYSINGVDYFNSNIFTGLENGSYTAYILDTYGLEETFDFEVSGVAEERNDPFIDISPVNSIQFSDETVTGNFFSKYSTQTFQNIDFQCFTQNFTQNDSITTQVRNNYTTLGVDVINQITNEVVQSPTATLKISNQNIIDKRDCVLKQSVDKTQTYIYFQGGNIYDPDTDDIIAKNTLNKTLETWMKEGLKVVISDQSPEATQQGTFDIVDVIYDNDLQGEVMIVDVVWSAVQDYQIAIITSEYDDEIWDVWEFDTDFSVLDEDGYYYIRVTATDDNENYPTRYFISEPIHVKNKGYVQLDYSTPNRTIHDIIPDTGISHRLRIPAQFYDYDPNQEVESFNDDFGNEIIQKRLTKIVQVFKTGLIPPYLVRKLQLAFLHSLRGDSFTINGLDYTPIADSDIEGKSDNRNPFQLLSQRMQSVEGSVATDENGAISVNNSKVLGSTTTEVIGL